MNAEAVMPKPIKLKPIKLTVWFKDWSSQVLRFNTCAEAERHLEGMKTCPMIGRRFFKFAIDKETR